MFKPSPVCAAIAVLLAAPLVHAAPELAEDVAARIDQVLSATYKADAPGATVIVVKDGKTLLRKAYGLADVERKLPLAADTPMRLGSITKQFTSTAILMLVDEGRIRLDDDITVYLPDYPTQGKKITIEHLLTHTSGIVSYTGKPGYALAMQKDLTVQQMVDSFKNDPLDFAPGSRYKYNNSGYFLLGAIIEKVSGKTYDKFVEERIFVPLGMTRSAYEGHERDKTPRAQGYTRAPEGFQPSKPISMTQPYAAGSLVSTVDDLARWDAAVSSGKLLQAGSWQRAFTPYTLSTGSSTGYGYGWETGTLRGAQMIGHGGGIPGFNSFALRLPAEKLYVAVLSNVDSGMAPASEAAYKAAAIAIGKPFPDYQARKLDPKLLDAYAGVYRAEGSDTRTVRRDGERLVLQRAGRPPVTLQAYSETSFFVPDSLQSFEFSRDAQGRVSQLVVHNPTADQVNPRIGDAPPQRVAVRIDHARFDAYAGRYQLTPGFVIELSRDGDRYWTQASGQGKVEVFALNEKTFFSNAVDAELRFDDAKPGQLVLAQGGRELKGAKLP
ncbi:serine hydrolase [Massilia norwichensis]|uniref:Serine hydrolase n=1 Tax=Massilia norwichensis TaxID=1442366 RepID=A0ABT2ADL9_9BURK|nr:serine hydrolase [Massilia norwichensis]MCS0592296.1 serine hydrolase [Massilia norwichensis]